MITSQIIGATDRGGPLWHEVENLKRTIADALQSRENAYLTRPELQYILTYKLRGQLMRTDRHRRQWSDDQVKDVTRAAFAIDCSDKKLELRARTAVLSALPGVGVAVASAILAITSPATYGIIDFRNWRQIFGTDRRTFSIADYALYMDVIWRFAVELGWDAQVVDWCVWCHDLDSGRVSSLRKVR